MKDKQPDKGRLFHMKRHCVAKAQRLEIVVQEWQSPAVRICEPLVGKGLEERQ